VDVKTKIALVAAGAVIGAAWMLGVVLLDLKAKFEENDEEVWA
jgi:hypothetical protein